MRAAKEWREGWLLVLAAMAGTGLSTSPTYAIGVFIAPLHAAFGWTRAELAAAVSITTIISSLLAPLVGRLIDRWGARRVALIGTAFFCTAFASLSMVTESIFSFQGLSVVIAMGMMLCSPLVWSIAVATRFAANRGLALSLTLTGSNIAGAIVPPLATALIQDLGWRMAYIALAGGLFLYTFPLAAAFFYDSGDIRRKHDKSVGAAAADAAFRARAQDGLSLREAMKTATFWLMAISFPIGGGAMVSMVVHYVPLLMDRGLSPMGAASGASMMSIGAVVGRVSAGFFLDRVFAPRIAAIVFTPAILGCIGLVLLPTNFPEALIFALLFGLALGAEGNLISYLASRYFGFKSFGLVYGVQFGLFATGCGLMPILIGKLYQIGGNYQVALIFLASCYFLSATLLQFCGRYPVWRNLDEDRDDGASQSMASGSAALAH